MPGRLSCYSFILLTKQAWIVELLQAELGTVASRLGEPEGARLRVSSLGRGSCAIPLEPCLWND